MRGFKRPSRCTGLHPPPCTVLGSRGRESPHGSSEELLVRHRVLPPVVLGRRQRPPPADSSSDDDEPPRRRPPPPPPRGWVTLFPLFPGLQPPPTTGIWGWRGGAVGGWVSHSPSHGRTASVAQASCPVGGGGCGHPRWLCSRLRHPCPPPSHGHVPRLGQGAGKGAREPGGHFWHHFGRAHCSAAG